MLRLGDVLNSLYITTAFAESLWNCPKKINLLPHIRESDGTGGWEKRKEVRMCAFVEKRILSANAHCVNGICVTVVTMLFMLVLEIIICVVPFFLVFGFYLHSNINTRISKKMKMWTL